MTPMQTDERYRSPQPARYALEVNQGWFDRHGILVGDIVEMNFITLAGDGDLVIGPGTCFTGGGESPLIRKHVAVLSEAVGNIGGLQVRNMVTIGGNLCRCMGYDTIIKAVEKRMDEDS